ncbi:MAG: P1 family peptidase [Thermoleophilia bacterium]|nr:P1 family peptidase [Thermoleophilia bacterium]
MPIGGVAIGHWTDADAGTGCTVVIPPPGTVGAIDVRGGGASTREAALLDPVSNVPGPTALLLTGGSAVGLDAAAGVTRWCRERGVGHDVSVATVPIVVSAVIFDLGITGGARVPGPDDAYAACAAARDAPPAQGCVGAGTGATVGKFFGREGWCKGGLGWAEATTYDGARVGALVVVNAFGDVLDERGDVLAGAWRDGIGFVRTSEWSLRRPPSHPRIAPTHTTLACVVTDAALTPVEATHVARAASAGVCRCVAPVNTALDGDVSFALATGARPAAAIGCALAAATATERAVRNAVRHAVTLRGVPTATMRRAGAD